HELLVFIDLRHAERARQHAVAARDAPWLARALHHTVTGALDRIGRADFGAGRLLAMHAHDRDRLHALRALHVFEMDHRNAAMRVALGARLYTRLAADAAIRVDEELEMAWLHCCGS